MVKTNFGSLEPEEKNREKRAAVELEKRKKHLESQTAFLSAAGSESHKVVIELISKKLTERIQEIIEQDPEALMCIKILQELGVQRKFAEQAATELEKLYLQQTT